LQNIKYESQSWQVVQHYSELPCGLSYHPGDSIELRPHFITGGRNEIYYTIGPWIDGRYQGTSQLERKLFFSIS